MKYFRKDWIMYQEVANEGGKQPEALIEINVKTDNPETNKHVPFIEETTNGYSVRCGKTEFHAETEEHHTIFIELVVDETYFYKKYIKYGEEPKVEFSVPKGSKVEAFAFCNLHGLWKFSL